MTIGRVHREWRESAKDLAFGIHIKITILLPSIHPGFGILYLSLCGHIYCHHHHLHNHNYLITKRMLWTQPQWTNGDGVRLIWKDVSPDHWCHLLSLHQYQCCHFKKYPNLWWGGQNSLIRRSTQLSCFLRAHLTLLSAIVVIFLTLQLSSTWLSCCFFPEAMLSFYILYIYLFHDRTLIPRNPSD